MAFWASSPTRRLAWRRFCVPQWLTTSASVSASPFRAASWADSLQASSVGRSASPLSATAPGWAPPPPLAPEPVCALAPPPALNAKGPAAASAAASAGASVMLARPMRSCSATVLCMAVSEAVVWPGPRSTDCAALCCWWAETVALGAAAAWWVTAPALRHCRLRVVGTWPRVGGALAEAWAGSVGAVGSSALAASAPGSPDVPRASAARVWASGSAGVSSTVMPCSAGSVAGGVAGGGVPVPARPCACAARLPAGGVGARALPAPGQVSRAARGLALGSACASPAAV